MWLPSKRLFTETFLDMCRMTTPHGYEPFVWAFLPMPPKGAAPGCSEQYRNAEQWIDEHGNWHVWIPYGQDYTGPIVMWTSHCDTADRTPTNVNFVWKDGFVMTDGLSILGADDKTGVTIMCMMIRAGVPGHYVFFAGEEVGCIGSTALAKECQEDGYDCCISFDRKGYDSIITHQCSRRTASDEWASELASRIKAVDDSLNYKPDNTGVFTDSRSFADKVSECTNISVGYFGQHTNSEKQDIGFAYDLCIAMIKLCLDGPGIPNSVRIQQIDDYDDTGYSWMLRHMTKTKKDPDFITEEEWKNLNSHKSDDNDWWNYQ